MKECLLSKRDADDWRYVGEGNLNLIVRYIGDYANYKGKVLRVIKSDKNEPESISQDSVTFKQQFNEKVIQPLLGKEYTVPMCPISTSKEFLQRLAETIEPHRPSSRLHKQINICSGSCFLLQDLAQLWPRSPTITFEVKPKWGFKPSSSHISTTTSKIKSTYCRFCMHSHLRNIKLNNFCPLDLYSTDRLRIRKTVNILIENLALKKTFKVSMNVDQQKASTFNVDNDTLMQDVLENIILRDPILQILKKLQMQLDQLDVEGIYSLYQTNESLRNLVTDDINIWQQVIDRFLLRQRQQTIATNEVDEQRQRIYEYILSMTFKDCSLMINVKPAASENSGEKVIKLQNGVSFQYDIKVIDTDLKSIDKIPYWYELDQSIVKHAIETNFKKDPCL